MIPVTVILLFFHRLNDGETILLVSDNASFSFLSNSEVYIEMQNYPNSFENVRTLEGKSDWPPFNCTWEDYLLSCRMTLKNRPRTSVKTVQCRALLFGDIPQRYGSSHHACLKN